MRASFERIHREARRISLERQAAERAQAEAEAEARLASGPRYQARAVGDYAVVKHFDPAAERQAQAAAKPN